MDWIRDKRRDEALAFGKGNYARYEIKRPMGPGDYLIAYCKGTRLAVVDTIDEGIRLCEWLERSGNA